MESGAESGQGQVGLESLRAAYAAEPAFRALVDHLAEARSLDPEVTVDALAAEVGIGRETMLAMFRKLHEARAGLFLNGRRGHSTRLRWLVDGRSLAQRIAAPDSDGEEPEIAHSFALRPNILVRFNLPRDLSPKEAQRLSSFIQTLPFEG